VLDKSLDATRRHVKHPLQGEPVLAFKDTGQWTYRVSFGRFHLNFTMQFTLFTGEKSDLYIFRVGGV
jgi:hypothetical protein